MKITHSVAMDFGTGILTISGLKHALRHKYKEIPDELPNIVVFEHSLEADVDFDGTVPIGAVILFAGAREEAALNYIMENFDELEELADWDDTFAFGDALVCFNPMPHGRQEIIFDEVPITTPQATSWKDAAAMAAPRFWDDVIAENKAASENSRLESVKRSENLDSTKTGGPGMSLEDFLAMNSVKTSLFGETPLSHLTDNQKERGQRDLAFLKTLLNMGK